MNAKTNQPDKATPSPWAFRHIKSGCHVVTVGVIESFGNGQYDIDPVCDMSIPEPTLEKDIDLAKANAALIVKAVNEYGALIALKNAVLNIAGDGLTNWLIENGCDGNAVELNEAVAAIRGQKVEGGK